MDFYGVIVARTGNKYSANITIKNKARICSCKMRLFFWRNKLKFFFLSVQIFREVIE